MSAAAGVLLAAGAGRRLGGPKGLVTIDGQLLVERGVQLLRAGGCAPVVVVLGAAAARIRARADLAGVTVVDNHEWASGMGSSLRTGLDAVEAQGAGADVGAAVVALLDQPRVGPEVLRRLLAAWRSGATVAVAGYDGRPRNPVLLDRGCWPAVRRWATGDRGARGFLRAHPELVTIVECADAGSPDDLDTPADLAAMGGRLDSKEMPPCS